MLKYISKKPLSRTRLEFSGVNFKVCFLAVLLSFAGCFSASAGEGNKMVFTQLKHKGHWDPYPDIYREVLSFMAATTSIEPSARRVVTEAASESLFDTAFLTILGSGDIGVFTEEETINLRNFISAGGIIFADSSDAVIGSVFAKSIRREFSKIAPQGVWGRIPDDQAVLRSFYLMKSAGGRRIVSEHLIGVFVDDFVVLVLSENDLFGAWARDNMGNYMYECTPFGESQRTEAMKLTANIIMYAFTGTYKADAIHLPYILNKLKSRY